MASLTGAVSGTVQAARDDVLVIVNDNSIDSPRVGEYYAGQRDIDPNNIVHVRLPAGAFMSWEDFRGLRDQLIHFMQENTFADPAQPAVTCVEGDPPFYCTASTDQLRTQTRIRYLVLTRGVPTRMTVNGSTLFAASAPSSVDNYLKYWLVNYFAEDAAFRFTEREAAFGDGRGMRAVEPAVDRELIVGRIDGLSLVSAQALVDRALAAERDGLYGRLFGSTEFTRWRDHSTRELIYPDWRYQLGVFAEDRPECIDYLERAGTLPEGKAPAYCRVQLNEGVELANPAPGNVNSRVPLADDALVYQGWVDGQAAVGSFDALLNWRKDAQCTVTLCANAADPAACRDASTDVLGEINSECVGVAEGFMGYNHQSFPVSYLSLWPTGWKGPGGSGDVMALAYPEVRTDSGFDDNFSLWFRNTDQVPDPRCYVDADFSLPPSLTCRDSRRIVLTQQMSLTSQTLDTVNPQAYRVALHYKADNLDGPTVLRIRFLVHETGAGNSQIDYGTQTLATIAPGDTDWTAAEVVFQLDPARHSSPEFNAISLTLDTAAVFAGELGLDAISVQEISEAVELLANGSFGAGHEQVATGDHAAVFLNRLNGTAFWGSVGHHQSGGCAFCLNGIETLVYFLRGLPLGDAVWFNDSNNSGVLYGDPLYSPVAVRLEPVNASDTLSGRVNLTGSTVNGRDPLRVATRYTIDYCAGADFFNCDQVSAAWQPTGIRGTGGVEHMPLGTWDASDLPPGPYTLRLAVTSTHALTGKTQSFHDYYPVTVQAVAVPIVAAILPGSRSALVGSTVTAFATLINPGATPLTGCGIAPATQVPADFSYQTTDPSTNAPTGTADTAVDLAAGAAQSFVIAFTPTQAFGATDVHFDFACNGTATATVIPGVNTLLLSASELPVPNIIALVASELPGRVELTSSGVFAVATANLGATGTLTVSADTGGATLPVTLSVCETDPLTSVCINPAVPTTQPLSVTVAAGATPTFAVFIDAAAPIAFDPAINGVFFRMRNQAGETVASTRVALSTAD